MKTEDAVDFARKITRWTFPSHEQLAAIEELIRFARAQGVGAREKEEWTSGNIGQVISYVTCARCKLTFPATETHYCVGRDSPAFEINS